MSERSGFGLTIGKTLAAPATRAYRWLWVSSAVLFFSIVFLLLLQAAMHKQLNHDEHMYVSSGVLLLRSQSPYADYPYFQMPLLTLIYGAAFWAWGDLLLAARLLNTIFAFGACLLLFFLVWRLLKGAVPAVRALLAVGSVILYLSGPQFIYTSGLAWNHDLPILLTLASLWLIVPEKGSRNIAMPFLLSGLMLGLATSTRLLFFVAAIPFGLAILLAPGTIWLGLRLRRLLIFGASLMLGLAPCLPFLIREPSAFLFGNVFYHGLNEQYWRSFNYERAMTPAGKLGYSFDVLVGEPANWLLALGALLALVMVARAGLRDRRHIVVLPFLTAIALFFSSLVPTPTWVQYFYAPYAMLAVAFALGTALLVQSRRWRLGVPLFALVTVVSAAYSVPRYTSLGNLLAFDDWTPVMVSTASQEIRAAVPSGTVVTLSPIYPLQAELDIYPGLASGPFGFRVANTISLAERREHGLLSGEDVLRIMREKPPEAILTGSEGVLEAPLVQYAAEQLYREVKLSNGLSLWLRPDR